MKKNIILLAACLMLAISAKSQIFQIDDEYNDNHQENHRQTTVPFKTPKTTGSESDSGAFTPIGGGAALLIGFGAAYLMAKRRKE